MKKIYIFWNTSRQNQLGAIFTSTRKAAKYAQTQYSRAKNIGLKRTMENISDFCDVVIEEGVQS